MTGATAAIPLRLWTWSAERKESARRSILLPVVTAVPNEGATLKRGVMNRLGFTVRNDASVDISNVTLGVEVLGHSHWSDPSRCLRAPPRSSMSPSAAIPTCRIRYA